MLISDKPQELDCPATWQSFPRLACISKDPLHIALKVEQAFGGRATGEEFPATCARSNLAFYKKDEGNRKIILLREMR